MSYQPPAYGPPSGYAAPPSGKQRLRGRTPRILGWTFLGLGIVGLVVGIVLAAINAFGAVDDFKRVSVSSGSGTVNLDRTGKWVIYYESDDVNDNITTIPAVQVAVTTPSGGVVSIKPYRQRSDGKVTKYTYDYHGHHGVAAYQFNASTTGAYQVRVEGSGLPSDADVAFGKDVIGSGLVAGGILVVVGILLIIAAIVLLIVGYVKRGRHKRELQGGYGYGGPPPPGYGSGYGGGYGGPPPQGWGPPGQAGTAPGFGPPAQ